MTVEQSSETIFCAAIEIESPGSVRPISTKPVARSPRPGGRSRSS